MNNRLQSQVDYLFVYGTLQHQWRQRNSFLVRGELQQIAHLLDMHGEYLAPATTTGNLYTNGRYPALVLTSNAQIVHGELWQIPSELWPQLDLYEGIGSEFAEPQEYHRTHITVTTDHGIPTKAWSYLYQWDLADWRTLFNGRF